jgi:hypothetical protein
MPREKLHHALKSTKAKFLNGLTYTKAAKNAIVYDHKSGDGMGCFDPYNEQGLSNIKHLLPLSKMKVLPEIYSGQQLNKQANPTVLCILSITVEST